MKLTTMKTAWLVGAGLIAAQLFANSAQAATIYVSPSGSNSNAGTVSSPLQTIPAAISAARAGDTIILKDGVYGSGASGMAVTINKAGTSSAWITLKAENKHRAIIDCGMSCHSAINFGASSAYWIVEGLDIRNTQSGGVWSNSGGGKNIVIRGNRIHHIGNRSDSSNIGICGVYTDSAASNFVIDGNIIHDVGRTNRVSNSFDHGIYSHGDLKVFNNVFYNSLNGWHIQTAVDFRGTIANNTFFGPNLFGKGAQITLWGANSNVTIRNNVFYGSTQYVISNAENSQQTNCRIDNNIAYTPGATLRLVDSLPSGCVQTNNRLNVDPMLVNPSLTNMDLRLRSGSPAIGTAVDMSSLYRHDHNGATRTAWDLGAYVFGGATSPMPTPTPAPSTNPTPVPTPPPASVYTASFVISGDPSKGPYSVGAVTSAPGDVRVEFYDNGVLVASESYAPYCLTPETSSGCAAGTLGTGVHNLEARFYAETGSTVLARATAVVTEGTAPDSQAPSVQLSAPSSTTVARGSQVSVSASASDNVGIARVEFYVNDVLVASDSSAAYSATFKISPVAGKTYRVEAIAYDQAGNARMSAPISLTSQ